MARKKADLLKARKNTKTKSDLRKNRSVCFKSFNQWGADTKRSNRHK